MEQLDYEEFNELFAYGPESNELINKTDRGKRAKKGESALSKNRQGRLQVRVKTKAILAERICLLLLNQVDPGDNITFKDGDYTNLKAENLIVGDGATIERKPTIEPEIKPDALVKPPALNGEVVQLKNGKWVSRVASGGGIKIVGHFETEALAIESLKR